VSVGADTEREPDGQRVTGPTFSIPIPLFDFGQAARMRSDAELQQATEHYRALVARISADVRKAAAKMAASRSRYQRFRDTIVPLRHQVVEETQFRYNGMLMDVLQLLEARQREMDAQRDGIAALRDYWMARTELERAVGGRLPADSATTQPPVTQPVTTQPVTTHPVSASSSDTTLHSH
jgi:cobalt-zinc-cadmium efflux system outer membrane protein